MSLTVTQRPNQLHSWVMTGNPILYKFQRKDYATSVITDSGGALQITVGTNLTTLSAALGGPVTPGSILWFKDDGGIYNAAYTVVTCTNAANSVVTFTAGTYTSGAGAAVGFVNLISNRPGYRVQVELYRALDNSLIFSRLESSMSAQGAIQVDVSILNEYIQQEPAAFFATWAGEASLATFFCQKNSAASLGFYIKYREVWAGSSESQTDDVANPSFAVKGARQIGGTGSSLGEGVGGYLYEYATPNSSSGRKFLTLFSSPVLWRERNNAISFVDPDVTSSSPFTWVKQTRYNADGSVWGATYCRIEYKDGINKGIFEVGMRFASAYQLSEYIQTGAGTSWSNVFAATLLVPPSITALTSLSSSKKILYPLHLKVGQTYSTTVSVDFFAPSGEKITVRLSAIERDGTVRYTVDSAALASGAHNLTFAAISPATNDTYFLGVEVIHNGDGAAADIVVASLYTKLNAYPGHSSTLATKRLDLSVVKMTNTVTVTETAVSATLQCAVAENPACNPVELCWRNSVGGQAHWVFEYSQEYSYRHSSDGGKRKRLILFANNLTADQWEALNELNNGGEIFRTPIQEMGAGVNKTHRRRGAQVYIMTTQLNYNKTGVIVIPTEQKSASKQKKHSLEIIIEYPEVLAPR